MLLVLFSLVCAQELNFLNFTRDSPDIPSSDSPIITSRWRWDVDWWPLANKYAPQRVRLFNAENGEILPLSADPGWSREFLYDHGPTNGARVGAVQIQGDDRETTSFITTAARGFTERLVENLHTDIYCRGALSYKSFFGTTADRFVKNDSANQMCVETCMETAGGVYPKSGNFSRTDLVDKLPPDCHVPLVHSFHAMFYKTIAQDSPTATLHIPKSVFNRAQIRTRDDLVEFLIEVDVSKCPPQRLNFKSNKQINTLGVGTARTSKDNSMFYTEQYSEREPPQFNTNGNGNKPATLDPMDIFPETTDTSTPSTTSTITPSTKRWLTDRPIDNQFGHIDFKETDAYQGPRFRSAPAMHYSSYMTSTFNGPSHIGHLIDHAIVIRQSSAFSYVVDIGKTVRRMWDLDTISIGILGSCNILRIDTNFVFVKAINWVYKPESTACTRQSSCQACRKTGCTWCRSLKPKGDDFLDIEWRNISQPRPQGRCGAPVHACVSHYGSLGNQNVC